MLSNLLLHKCELSALLNMPPTTLLEEKSWKGICGITVKLTGTHLTVFMHKLKQDKRKVLLVNC